MCIRDRDGRWMRKGECSISAIEPSMGDGARSAPNGSQSTTRPSSTTAVNAPQCASEGWRVRVKGGTA